MKKWVLVCGSVFVVALATSPVALADGTEEDFTARDLVEQAIGILQGQPQQTELIMDKLRGALEDDEPEGVDAALVARAMDAVEAGRNDEAIAILAGSIGVAADSALHQPESAEGFKWPNTRSDRILFGFAAIMIAVGGVIARRER